jgi:hypothetical protein
MQNILSLLMLVMGRIFMFGLMLGTQMGYSMRNMGIESSMILIVNLRPG